MLIFDDHKSDCGNKRVSEWKFLARGRAEVKIIEIIHNFDTMTLPKKRSDVQNVEV